MKSGKWIVILSSIFLIGGGRAQAEEVENVLNGDTTIETIYEGTIFESESSYATKTLLVQMEGTYELEYLEKEIARVALTSSLQAISFETEGDTEAAYLELQKKEEVIFVEIDAVTETSVIDLEAEGFVSYLSTVDTSVLESKVKIALIDTRVDINSSRVLESRNVLEESTGTSGDSSVSYLSEHGNQVADLLLNYTNAYVEIVPITAFNEEGKGTVLSAYLAIQEAIEQNVQVINMSFVGSGTSKILESIIEEARNQNIVVIVAAGNDGSDVHTYMPANVEAAITVGAIDAENHLTSYSNYGDGLDVVALGVYKYGGVEVNGTSISAAYVSSCAATLIQTKLNEASHYTTDDIEEMLCDLSIKIGEDAENLSSGEYLDEEEIDIPRDEDLFPPYDYETDLAQSLSVAIDLEPYNFYYYTDQALSVVQEDGNIYWSSASSLASGTTKFDNLYWDIQIRNESGNTVVVRIDEEDYKIAREEIDNWVYAVFEISKVEIQQMIIDAGYTLAEFCVGTVTVEFDGVIVIKKSDVIVEGPYALMYESQFTALMNKLDEYYFSQTSQDAVETKYKDKVTTIEGSVLAPTYYLDLNGYLDGELCPVLNGWASADVYIEGALMATAVDDYYKLYTNGTSYKVSATANEGYYIVGDGIYTGTVNGYTKVSVYINRIQYENTVLHYLTDGGDIGADPSEFYLMDETSFAVKYKENYTISELDFLEIPNGYCMYPQFSATVLDGKWSLYNMPYAVEEITKAFTIALYYELEEYEIKYELGEGTNADENPETYTVLDSIILKEPTREGYEFLGWYESEEEVTGINEEMSVSYEDNDVLKLLENRRTGDIVLTAKWNAIPELTVEDVYIFLDGEWDVERFFQSVVALDEEDGDISSSVIWENQEEVISQLEVYQAHELEEDMEYILTLEYSITDSMGACTYASSNVYAYRVFGEVGATGYVRFISYDYMDTLEENSVWKRADMYELLERTLM